MKDSYKLTKKYLMSLPERFYLVSDIFENIMQASFAEKVAPLDLRKKQWNRIVKGDVHQRICHLFETEEEYRNWLSALNYNLVLYNLCI
jgi:hypothetical protein